MTDTPTEDGAATKCHLQAEKQPTAFIGGPFDGHQEMRLNHEATCEIHKHTWQVHPLDLPRMGDLPVKIEREIYRRTNIIDTSVAPTNIYDPYGHQAIVMRHESLGVNDIAARAAGFEKAQKAMLIYKEALEDLARFAKAATTLHTGFIQHKAEEALKKVSLLDNTQPTS